MSKEYGFSLKVLQLQALCSVPAFFGCAAAAAAAWWDPGMQAEEADRQGQRHFRGK